VRAADGRGEATALRDSLFTALDVADLPQLVHKLHGGSDVLPGEALTKAEIAELAPRVIDAAIAEDAVAQRIIREAIDALVLMVETVAGRLDFDDEPVRVVTAGGLAHNPSIAEPLAKQLANSQPGATVTAPLLEPVKGAALLALQSAGVTVDETLINTMQAGAKMGEASP
jgi:N-acetylglucosamine kinase-like BadF-type ATPase